MAGLSQKHSEVVEIARTTRTNRLVYDVVVEALREDHKLTASEAHRAIFDAVCDGAVSLVWAKVFPSYKNEQWCIEAPDER